MGLRKDWPAIRAEWIKVWLERGTVKAIRIRGTPIYFVVGVNRPSKTFHRRTRSGRIVKKKIRYYLKDVYLNPRWQLLGRVEKDSFAYQRGVYDPIADAGVEHLSAKALGARGMYRARDGRIYVLIFQHVAGIDKLKRQLQEHIRGKYRQELRRISTALREVEEHMLETIDTGQSISTAARNALRERRSDVETIQIILAPRGEAARIKITRARRIIGETQRSLQGILRSKTMADLIAARRVKAKGLQVLLTTLRANLDELHIRPLVTGIKRAQRHILAAKTAIKGRNGSLARHKIKLALQALTKTLQSLE